MTYNARLAQTNVCTETRHVHPDCTPANCEVAHFEEFGCRDLESGPSEDDVPAHLDVRSLASDSEEPHEDVTAPTGGFVPMLTLDLDRYRRRIGTTALFALLADLDGYEVEFTRHDTEPIEARGYLKVEPHRGGSFTIYLCDHPSLDLESGLSAEIPVRALDERTPGVITVF